MRYCNFWQGCRFLQNLIHGLVRDSNRLRSFLLCVAGEPEVEVLLQNISAAKDYLNERPEFVEGMWMQSPETATRNKMRYAISAFELSRRSIYSSLYFCLAEPGAW